MDADFLERCERLAVLSTVVAVHAFRKSLACADRLAGALALAQDDILI